MKFSITNLFSLLRIPRPYMGVDEVGKKRSRLPNIGKPHLSTGGKASFLAFVTILFLFTRLYKITEIPSSVYWDEASIGYNAYSIAQTGKDEWGEFLPIHFRAFGEFKLPVYIYATAVSIKLFGLNAFSVRLSAVLFSLGVVVLTYLLAKKLSNDEFIGLFSSFFIATSPWFFIFSRTGYEVTAGLMFYLLAVYFFLKIDKNIWLLLFSVISFILSAYSYNSFRIIAPLTILILIIYEIKTFKIILRKHILIVLVSIFFLSLSLIPVYRLYRYDAGIFRLQAVSTTSTSFVKNYLSHFSLDFLFLQGDKNLRSQQAGFGQLYLADIALLPLGFLYVIRSKSKYKLLPLILVLLGPIPAAITKESPHALRAISMIPFLSIISAEGVAILCRWIGKKYLIGSIVTIIFLIFFTNYFLKFINTYPTESAEDWQYGYKRIFTDFKEVFPKYDRIIISDEYAQPYIFALFYQKIDPNKFRKTVVRNPVSEWGFSTVESFDKFEFGKIKNLVNKDSKGSLIFASEEEKLPDANPIGDIKFLNGEIIFWVYEI